VIGAYKSGTTALHHALRAHPEVFVPESKEPSFLAFADVPDPSNPAYSRAVRDEAAYLSLFRDAGSASAVGEVSPEYLLNPAAAESIARRIPDVTLLALLRNPVDRAFSDWVMYVRDGTERAEFARALEMQDERRRRGEPTGNYLGTGEYARQLSRYVERFPREQVHVWLYDDLVADPVRMMRQVFQALGVDPDVDVTLGDHNVGSVPTSTRDRVLLSARTRLRPILGGLQLAGLRRRASRSLEGRLVHPEMERETRRMLVEHYRSDIEALQTLLGRDLSVWLQPG
jgi:hypothetical protein